jgi:hypothetical protein
MAFHRAIYQLDGIKHFCEPFTLPHYFGPERKSKQFEDKQDVVSKFAATMTTNAEKLKEIVECSDGSRSVFIKENAVHVWPGKIPNDVLGQFVHTFIIRNPEKAIKSLYRRSLLPFDEGLWSRIISDELGFKEQLLMYNHVTKVLKQPAIIIDADDLLSNPREVMQSYCAFVGLEFEESMLDWSIKKYHEGEANPWEWLPKAWLKDMTEANNLADVEPTPKAGIVYPGVIFTAIQQNMKYYQEMWSQRLQVEYLLPIQHNRQRWAY